MLPVFTSPLAYYGGGGVVQNGLRFQISTSAIRKKTPSGAWKSTTSLFSAGEAFLVAKGWHNCPSNGLRTRSVFLLDVEATIIQAANYLSRFV